MDGATTGAARTPLRRDRRGDVDAVLRSIGRGLGQSGVSADSAGSEWLADLYWSMSLFVAAQLASRFRASCFFDALETGMPLKGEYEPNPMQFVADQVELYESSGGTQGTTLQDLTVVILTILGAKSGKIRNSPVMRMQHDGSYAVVASGAGAPSTGSGTTTWWPTPGLSSRTAQCARTCSHAR